MPIDEPTLAKLLRLKRYEQPRPGYFDDFLREFQRRQRAELLRRPLWRIVLDRLEPFWGETFSLPRVSYAMASAAVLCVAAALTWTMVQHPGSGMRDVIAGVSAQDAQEPKMMSTALAPQIRIPDALLEPDAPLPATARQYPHYILDTRPASYEPPFSF